MANWERWISHPQNVWLRKAIFQLHLWSGIAIGLYVLMVSVTGSIIVYRNELYAAATRDPIIVTESGTPLTDEDLKAAAARAYPGYSAAEITRPLNRNQAVTISLKDGSWRKDRTNPHHASTPPRRVGFRARRITSIGLDESHEERPMTTANSGTGANAPLGR